MKSYQALTEPSSHYAFVLNRVQVSRSYRDIIVASRIANFGERPCAGELRTGVTAVVDPHRCELRTARLAAGLTQEELAFKADISRNYVSLLEPGENSPTVQVLLRICKALGVRESKIIARIERG